MTKSKFPFNFSDVTNWIQKNYNIITENATTNHKKHTLKTVYGSLISTSKSSETLRFFDRISIGLVRPSRNLISDLTLLCSKWNCYRKMTRIINKLNDKTKNRPKIQRERNYNIEVQIAAFLTSSSFSQSWNSALARSLASSACIIYFTIIKIKLSFSDSTSSENWYVKLNHFLFMLCLLNCSFSSSFFNLLYFCLKNGDRQWK